MMEAKRKSRLVRLVEWSLGAHGFLHIFEFGVAIYEEAFITASLAAFGGLSMIAGALVLGRGHHHHHHHSHHGHDSEEDSE